MKMMKRNESNDNENEMKKMNNDEEWWKWIIMKWKMILIIMKIIMKGVWRKKMMIMKSDNVITIE